MIGRQSLGWAALATVVIGSVLLVLFLGPFDFRLDSKVDSLSGATAAAFHTAAFGALVAVAGGVLGAFAWRTGPGKAAVIGSILIAVGAVVYAGLMYLGWVMSNWGA
jgi:hypothetical protein